LLLPPPLPPGTQLLQPPPLPPLPPLTPEARGGAHRVRRFAASFGSLRRTEWCC
jgi:hypothetical protein